MQKFKFFFKNLEEFKHLILVENLKTKIKKVHFFQPLFQYHADNNGGELI